jgi:hypothetical protein
MADNQQLDLESIINKHFESQPEEASELITKLEESKNKPVKDGFENLVEKLKTCRTIKEDYKRKHKEIIELKSNCDLLVELIIDKLSIDKGIIKELISVFSRWSDEHDLSEFSIDDQELTELVNTQKSLLEDLDKTIKEFNNTAADMHKLPMIDIKDTDKLKKLLDGIDDPEKILNPANDD